MKNLQERLERLTAKQIMILERVAMGQSDAEIQELLSAYVKKCEFNKELQGAYKTLGISRHKLAPEAMRAKAAELYRQYEYPGRRTQEAVQRDRRRAVNNQPRKMNKQFTSSRFPTGKRGRVVQEHPHP